MWWSKKACHRAFPCFFPSHQNWFSWVWSHGHPMAGACGQCQSWQIFYHRPRDIDVCTCAFCGLSSAKYQVALHYSKGNDLQSRLGYFLMFLRNMARTWAGSMLGMTLCRHSRWESDWPVSLEVGGDLAVKRRITLCYQWSLEVAEGFQFNRECCELTSLLIADSPLFQQHHQSIYSNAKLTHHIFFSGSPIEIWSSVFVFPCFHFCSERETDEWCHRLSIHII